MDSLLEILAAYESEILESPISTSELLASNTLDIETDIGPISPISPNVLSAGTIAERRRSIMLPRTVEVPMLNMPESRRQSEGRLTSIAELEPVAGEEAGAMNEAVLENLSGRESEMGSARRGAIVAPLAKGYSEEVAAFETCSSPGTDSWVIESESEGSDVEDEEVEDEDEVGEQQVRKSTSGSKERTVKTVAPLIRHRSHMAVIESCSPTDIYNTDPDSGTTLPLRISRNDASPSEYAPSHQDLSPFQAVVDQFTEPLARSPARERDEDNEDGDSKDVHWSECASPRSLGEVSNASSTRITSGLQPIGEMESNKSEKGDPQCSLSSPLVRPEEGMGGMAGPLLSMARDLSTESQNPWANDGRKSFAWDIVNVVQDDESMVACIDVFSSLDVEGLIADSGLAFVDLDLDDADWMLEPHPLSSRCWCYWCDVERCPELVTKKHDFWVWCRCLSGLGYTEKKRLEEMKVEEGE